MRLRLPEHDRNPSKRLEELSEQLLHLAEEVSATAKQLRQEDDDDSRR